MTIYNTLCIFIRNLWWQFSYFRASSGYFQRETAFLSAYWWQHCF